MDPSHITGKVHIDVGPNDVIWQKAKSKNEKKRICFTNILRPFPSMKRASLTFCKHDSWFMIHSHYISALPLSVTSLWTSWLILIPLFCLKMSCWWHAIPPGNITYKHDVTCVPFQRDSPAATADYADDLIWRRLKVGISYGLWPLLVLPFLPENAFCSFYSRWCLTVCSTVCFFASVSYMCFLQHP